MKTTIISIVLILLGGGYLAMTLMRILCCKTPTTATVTEIKRTSSRSGRGSRRVDYSPICTFLAGGTPVTAEAATSSARRSKYRAGDSVEILYNEAKPEEFIIKGQYPVLRILGSICLVILGVLALWSTFAG